MRRWLLLLLATWLATFACGPGDECPSGLELCGDVCTDVKRDRENCGACGVRCASGEACDGACRKANPAKDCPGKSEPGFCNDQCVDLSRDDNNCGACGVRCAATESCVFSKCDCSDPSCFGGN